MKNENFIIVGIPTFKRPTPLKTLLDSISQITIPTNSKILILVVDNDPGNASTESILSAFSDNCSFETKRITVADRGISQVRNAMLEYAFEDTEADYLAMVDDDETVHKHWLVELLKSIDDYGTDFVGGNKKPKFSESPERWMEESYIYASQRPSQSGICERLKSTDNLMMTKSAYYKLNKPKFDLSFALTGGGDSEFLYRAKLNGAKFSYSHLAMTYEIVPIERMNLTWAKARSYRIGVGLARIDILHSMNPGSLLYRILRATAALTRDLFIYLLFSKNEPKRIQNLLLVSRQFGKFSGYMGKVVYPYNTTDGKS